MGSNLEFYCLGFLSFNQVNQMDRTVLKEKQIPAPTLMLLPCNNTHWVHTLHAIYRRLQLNSDSDLFQCINFASFTFLQAGLFPESSFYVFHYVGLLPRFTYLWGSILYLKCNHFFGNKCQSIVIGSVWFK
jgi:hypothetical protein